MTGFVARMRDLAESLGLAGVAGIALVVFGAVAHFSFVEPARDELAALHARFDRTGRGGQAMEATPAGRGAEQLRQFRGYFPPVGAAAGLVLRMHELAREQELALDTGEYAMSRDPELRMLRYQVQLPLKGAYPKVRRFLVRVLDEMPGAALDEVSMRRETVGSGTVETRVKLTLYLAEPS
jgi:hypothetical protein